MPKPEEIYPRLRDNKVPLAFACTVLAALLIMAISLSLSLYSYRQMWKAASLRSHREKRCRQTSHNGRYSNKPGSSCLPRMLHDP